MFLVKTTAAVSEIWGDMLNLNEGTFRQFVPRVLVVDDESDVLFVMEQFLQKEGLKVLTAKSGEYALEILRVLKMDLVLLDIAMPGMDGIETLREIKKIDPNLMTVMVTANGGSEKIVEAFNSGAYDYIIKPLNFRSFREGVISKLMQ